MQFVLMQCNMNHDGPYYFEDFTVGQRFESAPHVTTEQEALAFANRYDPQAQHIDPVGAKESAFGTLVLSGWETASITMRQKLDGPLGNVANGMMGIGVEKMRWHLPVAPGDTLRAFITITGTRPSNSKPDKGVVAYTVESFNQKDERVLEMQIAVLMPRREA
jgi:acyl dehydratase